MTNTTRAVQQCVRSEGSLRDARVLVMSAVLVLLALAGCGAPPTTESQLPPAGRDVWVLVVHGSGDGPERWASPMVERLSPRVKVPSRVEWIAYDWRAAAVDKLSAAERGQAEGAAIARVLRERPLSHVHVVAHSAGAHVAFGIEEAMASWPSRPTLHLTLLDPFLGKGLDFDWGRTRFGARADFTEAFLNRGDGVPGTEAVVQAAHTFDVTNTSTKPSGLTGSQAHWWPIDAYGAVEPGFSNSWEVAGAFDGAELVARFPSGQSESLP